MLISLVQDTKVESDNMCGCNPAPVYLEFIGREEAQELSQFQPWMCPKGPKVGAIGRP